MTPVLNHQTNSVYSAGSDVVGHRERPCPLPGRRQARPAAAARCAAPAASTGARSAAPPRTAAPGRAQAPDETAVAPSPRRVASAIRRSRSSPARNARVVDVEREREHLLRDLRGDAEHLDSRTRSGRGRAPCGAAAACGRARTWSRTRRAGRSGSTAGCGPRSRSGLARMQQRERLAVAELVVAPLLEPLEDRVEAQLGMPLELAEDRDVARVADLLRQVGRVEDELGPEVGVLLRPRQEAQVHADAEVLAAHWLMKPAWRASSRAM